MTLADAIDTLITRHGTLTALSRHSGVDKGYLSRMHHGEKLHPTPETLALLGIVCVADYSLGEAPRVDDPRQLGLDV